jgi:signal transduction histidine kinase
VLSTAVAFIVSRRVTTPLHALSQAARAVAEGDYGRSVQVSRRDELGEVAAAFNVMTARVSEAHSALEHTVQARTAQLEERNDELEAFAHSISHDLRAPLRAMHGFSHALLEDNGPQLDATGRGYATRIVAAAARLDAMIHDLLTYSRVSRTELAIDRLDTVAVIRAAISQLSAEIEARNALVVVDESMPAVSGHRAMLEQVVANLVANALKFVAPDARPEVTIRASRDAEFVRLWIVDNGIGIDPAHQQRIFSVFERLHAEAKFPGTGIGLAIVRKGAERMGGRAGVESALGRGSRFWIDLVPAEN